jgi:hypothetical protein
MPEDKVVVVLGDPEPKKYSVRFSTVEVEQPEDVDVTKSLLSGLTIYIPKTVCAHARRVRVTFETIE